MSDYKDKRYYRNLKRDVKKAGNRQRRRDLQRQLDAGPEHLDDVEVRKHRSDKYNGLDHDRKRHKKDEWQRPLTGSCDSCSEEKPTQLYMFSPDDVGWELCEDCHQKGSF